ncbi:hypothetical protein HDU98_009509 [Podochytrium sp. JEL0797]|nr:hypothetical protein HDU98_009509 [Podochytrium sp. JEL0797]
MQDCNQCGIPKALKLCSACKTAKYCSVACQKKHWLLHKPECSILRVISSSEIPADPSIVFRFHHILLHRLLESVSFKDRRRLRFVSKAWNTCCTSIPVACLVYLDLELRDLDLDERLPMVVTSVRLISPWDPFGTPPADIFTHRREFQVSLRVTFLLPTALKSKASFDLALAQILRKNAGLIVNRTKLVINSSVPNSVRSVWGQVEGEAPETFASKVRSIHKQLGCEEFFMEFTRRLETPLSLADEGVRYCQINKEIIWSSAVILLTPNLTVLVVEAARIHLNMHGEQSLFTNIAKLENLHTLVIRGMDSFSRNEMRSLSKCPRLKRLMLDGPIARQEDIPTLAVMLNTLQLTSFGIGWWFCSVLEIWSKVITSFERVGDALQGIEILTVEFPSDGAKSFSRCICGLLNRLKNVKRVFVNAFYFSREEGEAGDLAEWEHLIDSGMEIVELRAYSLGVVVEKTKHLPIGGE